MIDKQQEKKQWRDTKIALAKQINELLFEHKMSVVDVAERTSIPLHIMENLSLGREIYNNGDLRAFARFFDKKIKIELVD